MAKPPYEERFVPEGAIQQFEAPVGQLILNYALAEQALDIWLMELFPAAVKANVAAKVPHELGRKIELAKKCFERLPAYTDVKDDAEPLLDILQHNAALRNTLAHGVISHFDNEPEATMIFSRLRYSKEEAIHVATDEIVPLMKILTVNDAILEAIRKMHAIARKLHAIPASA